MPVHIFTSTLHARPHADFTVHTCLSIQAAELWLHMNVAHISWPYFGSDGNCVVLLIGDTGKL